MSNPLLSVIIPTYNRPNFLPKAIRSALAHSGDSVEVIVVPNGPDDSYKDSLREFESDSRVCVSPISKANGNAARNHGMSCAKGSYLRFLDDDDYLLPGASEQLSHALFHDLDICSGNVTLVSDSAVPFKILIPPSGNDIVAGILSPERKTGLQFHLYRKKAIMEFRFREDIAIGQDTHWMHTLCRSREWRWATVETAVCTWVQHSSQSQISRKHGALYHLKLQELMLWDTIAALNASGRLTDARKAIASRGMWHLIHSGFFLSPWYWLPVIKKVQAFSPGTYPDIAFYRNKFGKKVHPALLESLMLPKRWMNHSYRQALVKLGLKSQWQFSP